MDDYYDLGTYSRDVSTNSEQARLWFNRGLLWSCAYNHYESANCFRKAAEFDPDLASTLAQCYEASRIARGALLLEQGQVKEAEHGYRGDLGLNNTLIRACQHPENVWSLRGFHECLLRLEKDAEATMIALRLDLAKARADVPIKSSCLCRVMHAA